MDWPSMGARTGILPYPAALLLLLLFSAQAAFATNIAPDYPLNEKPIAQEIAVAPVIVEGTVVEGGSFQAVLAVESVYKNTWVDGTGQPVQLPRLLRLAGFNSMAGDRTSRAMRKGERAILLLSPAGDLFFTPRSGAGRYVIEAATEFGEAKLVASLGDPTLLVPLDPEHFRTLLRAIIAFQALDNRALTGGVDDPYGPTDPKAADMEGAPTQVEIKEWRQQVELGETLAQTSLQSANPVRQYFGVVLARSLFSLARLPELLKLSESDNPRLQAESLEALAGLLRRHSWADPALDRVALLRSARAGLSAKALRTRLAAALALQEMPADGVARDLMTFYRDAAAEALALKLGDEKRAAFIDQRDRFWLSPALLLDVAAEDILLDFSASNDPSTASGALSVLGLRGSATSIPGLIELLGEKDFKHGDDAKVALFRITLSDEILLHTVDLKTWAAAAQKQSYLERLQAGLTRVNARLVAAAGVKVPDDERGAAVLLASCIPGEVSLPALVHQQGVPISGLPPVVFARTQSPLAFPYLSSALLSGNDNTMEQAEMSLRGWALLDPLVRFACDTELGAAAARHTLYGDNSGLDACADLTPPGAAYGIIAGLLVDGSIRNRGRRFQLLQSFTGQSYGWGENEVEWNTALSLWSQFQAAQARAYRFDRPPALQQWLVGAQHRLALPGPTGAILAGDTLQGWLHDLASPDPRQSRAAWRNLALAGLPPDGVASAALDRTPVRAEMIAKLSVLLKSGGGVLQERLLAANLLGFLRAPVAEVLIAVLAETTDPALKHQLWWALSRTGQAEQLTDESQRAILALVQKTAAETTDPIEQTLAIWALCDLPGADPVAGLIVDDDHYALPAQRTAAAVLLYRASHRPLPATLMAVGRGLGHVSDDRLRELLLASLAAGSGNLTPALRELRLTGLAGALANATSANADLPSSLLRTELSPLPGCGPDAWRLSPATKTVLHDEFMHALSAAAAAADPTLGDEAERAYAWAYATGAWPGREFLDLQRDALDPFGRAPARRTRTAAYLLEGLMHSGLTLPAERLRVLMANDDDRLASFAAFLLARYKVDEDLLDIFNRFNRATTKTQTWLNAVASTSSPDAYKFLTDTAKSAGYDAYMAGWALGYFESAGARTRLTTAATDPRQSNASAAIFGWTVQLQRSPDRMATLAEGDLSQQLLLCDALEQWPPLRLKDATPALMTLLHATDGLVRARAQMVLCRLSGLKPLPAAASGNPPATGAEAVLAPPADALVHYWTDQLNLPAPVEK